MYHPYKEGYSLLPKLKRIDKEDVFKPTFHDLWHYREQKKEAVKNQCVYVERHCSEEIKKEVTFFINDYYPHALAEPHVLSVMAMQMQEDLIIHRMDDERDWMALGHVCFPSGWEPQYKVGRRLEEIHAPIPGMRLDNSRKLVEAMVTAGPFERFVWSVIFENRINGHPRKPKKKFNPDDPEVFVKVERQVTVPFPEVKAALFLLRQYILTEKELDKPALIKSLNEMTPEQRSYKGVDRHFDDLVKYLEAL